MESNKGYCQQSLKFGGIIPQGIHPSSGLQVRIKGVINQNRLVINFSNNENENDIGCHISIWPCAKVIVRNDYVDGCWGAEEKCGVSPIQFGCPFDILISGQKDKYRIEINGKHFSDFNHRCPAKETKYFSLYGDDCKIEHVSLNNINEGICVKNQSIPVEY